MTYESEGSPGRKMVMKIWQDGTGRRIVKFLEPPTAKGMAIFVESADTIYVYLPKYHRVRRVASHARRQTFMGTDFTYDDMRLFKYGIFFEAVKADEDKDFYILTLRRKKGADISYGGLVLYIDKKYYTIHRIDYLDEDMTPIKREIHSGWKWVKGRDTPSPLHVEMINLKTGHKTVIDFSELKYNVKLPRGFFSKRTLMSERLR